MKLSVTHLATFLYCKRKLWLQQVLGLKEIPKKVLVQGSVRHEIHDLIHKQEENIVKSISKKDRTHVLESYLKNYKKILKETLSKNQNRLNSFKIDITEFHQKIWKLLIEEAAFRTDIVYSFIEKNNIFQEELWQKLTPKIESELRIDSDKLQLKGIIDQILVYDTGFVPIELKTGSTPREGVWPGHRVQLAAYALLIEDKFNQEVKEGFVHYLDGKQKRHIAINPFLREEIKDLIKEVQALIKSKQIPERVKNINKCNACGLRKQCYDDKFITDKVRVLKQTTIE